MGGGPKIKGGKTRMDTLVLLTIVHELLINKDCQAKLSGVQIKHQMRQVSYLYRRCWRSRTNRTNEEWLDVAHQPLGLGSLHAINVWLL